MIRNVLSAALAIVVLAMFAGCQRLAAPEAGRDATRVANAATPEKIDAAAIENELIKMEREWAAAAKAKDAEAVRRVLADDVVITYPDGTTGKKADEVRSVEAGYITADSWELTDPKVTVLNADTAFITGRGIIRKGKYKDDKMKRAVDISGEYRFLDVYARRNGKWQAVASQTTQIRTAN